RVRTVQLPRAPDLHRRRLLNLRATTMERLRSVHVGVRSMIGSMKRPLECTLAAIALLVLGACGEESSPLRVVPVAPAVTRVVAGDNQAGAVGRSAPEQLTVLVTDRFDNPVPGVDVTFTVTAGEGSVEPAAARTGRDGIARATWKLGTKAGTQTVTAAVPGLDPVVFSAEVAPGPPDALRRISGDGQTATVGQPLPQPLVVEVTDAYGNPVSGVGVEWLAGAGGGLVNASTATTDAAGRAQATWTLGPRAGEQRLTVIAGQSAVTVVAAAGVGCRRTAGNEETGNAPSAPAGSELSQRLVVKVADAHGNGVAGITVQWEVTAGGGSVNPATAVTDAEGLAWTRLTLGRTPGQNTVTAAVPGLDPVVFSAEAAPGPPNAPRRRSGDGQTATVGQPLPQPLVVEVVDSCGNPIARTSVNWSIGPVGGNVTPSSGTTDANGRAQAVWTLGTKAGTQTVTAAVPGLDPVVFSAEAAPGPPFRPRRVSGDGQTATVGQPLPQPLV